MGALVAQRSQTVRSLMATATVAMSGERRGGNSGGSDDDAKEILAVVVSRGRQFTVAETKFSELESFATDQVVAPPSQDHEVEATACG